MPSPISVSSSHRAPTRSSSAASLPRDKGRPFPAIPDPPSPSLPPRGQSYFDRYPRPSSSRQDQHKSHEPRRPSVGRVNTEFISKPKPRRNGRTEPPDSDDDASQNFAFPIAKSTQSSEVCHDSQLTPKPPSRRRSRTNSNKMSRPPPVDVSYLRTSGSSTQTQVETPPQTPIDFPVPRAFIDPFPVVVSAPISGVETMDALVDGMNGFDTDDLFAGSAGLSGRAGKKDRFHPIYQPPLPTPPPGVTLGGAMPRKSPTKPKPRNDDAYEQPLPTPTSTRRSRPSLSTRSPSSSTVTADSSFSSTTTHDVSPPTSPALSRRSSKGMAPSISDIIRAYAPPEQRLRSSATSHHSSIPSSLGHTALKEEHESEPEPLSLTEEADLLSRSSVDSIADEVRKTLENQTSTPSLQIQTGPYARSLPSRYSVVSDAATSHASPRSDRRSSYYSSPAAVEVPDPPIEFPTVRQTQSQSIAQYLRSARLTTLLKLTRSPHASIDNPLTVSLSDLGSPTGIPLVVFLGLGSVRYVMGLYDEMAECLGIRLITIDRWGLGRTDTPRHKSTRGIPEWASAVEEVLDLLRIERCSVMAHSAGAPYALSFANKVPERIRGEVLLLAPWVGGVEGAGYKWLKYVPTGILKTAQAAEWRIQAWMLGKPPTIAFEGIGYDASASTSTASSNRRPRSSRRRSTKDLPSDSRPIAAVSPGDAQPRPSTASSVFSEYDDLGDFEGRFDSRSTLGAKSVTRHRSASENKRPSIITRKTSRGFLNMLKPSTSNQSQPQSPSAEKTSSPSGPGRRLKALRSMGSLRGKSSSSSSTPKTADTPPRVPQTLKVDVGLGLDTIDWVSVVNGKQDTGAPYSAAAAETRPSETCNLPGYNRRAHGRRSISFGATTTESSPPSMPSSPLPPSTVASPPPSTHASSSSISATSSYQAALGNALIVASHAESSKGTHSDLLQILNHDQQPWGFSYTAYPHNVRIWYGDRDEKIAENAVRWMEKNMSEERCQVKVVKGADHGLMYRSSVVVEVLEHVRDTWTDDSC